MNSLFVSDDSHVAAFIGAEQVPELEAKSLLELWAQRAESLGHDPTTFVAFSYNPVRARIARREEGAGFRAVRMPEEDFVEKVMQELEHAGAVGPISLGRSERDAIAIAIGRLAVERPGWEPAFLRPLAQRLGVEAFFDKSMQMKREEAPPA